MPGIYDEYGKIITTPVSGSTRTGIYAPDGSINVVLNDSDHRGLYHPCGAFRVSSTPGETYHDGTGAARLEYLLGGAIPTWVTPGASLDLDFVNNRYFGGIPTCTRSSVGYIDDSDGNWTEVPANTVRVSDKGILIEEARTNYIRNNSGQGAVAGSPGTLPTHNGSLGGTGLTREIVGTGTENGIDGFYIRWSGTPETAFVTIELDNGYTLATASEGQQWTASIFTRLAAGSAEGLTFSLDVSQSGVTGISSTTISMDGTLRRTTRTRTMPEGTTAAWARLGITYTVGVPVDFTLFVGGHQLELGAFATSPIRTTGAAATRAADVVSVSLGDMVAGGAYSIYAIGRPNAPTDFGTNQTIIQLDDGTVNNRPILFRVASTGDPLATVLYGGSATGFNAVDLGSPHAQNDLGKYALAIDGSGAAACFNGGTVSTGTPPGVPSVSTLRVGSNQGGASLWNGYVEQITVFPTRLSDSELQVLTS